MMSLINCLQSPYFFSCKIVEIKCLPLPLPGDEVQINLVGLTLFDLLSNPTTRIHDARPPVHLKPSWLSVTSMTLR